MSVVHNRFKPARLLSGAVQPLRLQTWGLHV
jgi:hypothetical protein